MLYDKKNQREKPKLILGDVVIIKENNLKPMHWKRGRIIELLSGKDAEIRGVKLQSTSPTGKLVYINRSVQMIMPIEIASASDFNGQNTDYISKTSERVDGDLNVAELSNVQNKLRDQDENEVNDLRKITENENIQTIDPLSRKKTRVLPKRSVAILGEIKRRFDSDRCYVNLDIPISQPGRGV